MKKPVTMLLALALCMGLAIPTPAVDGYEPYSMEDSTGNEWSFSSAKVESRTITLEKEELTGGGEVVENATVILMAPGSTLHISGGSHTIAHMFTAGTGDGCYALLYDGSADEIPGNSIYSTDEMFRDNERWDAPVSMWSFPVASGSQADDADDAYVILDDGSSAPAEPLPPVNSFTDVPADAYYADAVSWAVRQDITTGTGEYRFSRDTVCTIAQAVTFLWRASGSPEPTIQNPFSDVFIDDYSGKAAIWAYEKGLISGSEFDGERPCTRSAVITYLWKLSGQPNAEQAVTDVDQAWNLLLVNPWNELPQGFTVELTSIGNGHAVDARCADALQEMLSDCRAAGLSPVVCSSYRTQQKQEFLFNRRVAARMAQGMSQAEAEAETAKSIAVPGTSEHQIGLAVDIVDNHNWSLDKSQADMPAQKWLMAHSWEYGFILRYPSEKSSVTGIIYEPWHYRYVGKDAARTMYEQGTCLEEYIQHMKEYERAVAWAMEQGVTDCTTSAEFAPNENCTRGQMVTFMYRIFAQQA